MSEVYVAACQNVRELKTAEKSLLKQLNLLLRENSQAEIRVYTKLYLLLFAEYSEASFFKLIHTPCALSDSEIESIQNTRAGSKRSLEEQWKELIDRLINKLNSDPKGETANKKQQFMKLFNDYIIPSIRVRNKIAHGQWIVAFNSNCTSISSDTTNQIKDLDYVKISTWFQIYDQFIQCIEDLLESPKTHYRDYYPNIVALKDYIVMTKNWNMESKQKKLETSSKHAGYCTSRQPEKDK